MEKQKQSTVKELVSEGKKRTNIKVTLRNEPNIRLMAEAALNLYHDNH